MTILIVEDEKPAVTKLKQLLKKIDASITIVDAIETVESCINWLQANPLPDLILMDIQLNDGICFEIFDVIKITTPIIFTTAYDEYVMKVFKVNGIDYLLKPVDLEKLSKAINKYNSLFAREQVNTDKMNHVYNELAKDYKTRFLVKRGSHYNSVLTNDIECFFIKGQYTYLRTFTGKKYDLEYSLQQLETVISPDHFFRINRNYIVHINSIANILSYSANRLKLILKNSTGEELIVSREKVTEFKKWLDK
jgi:two-component system, LytTR family, response regulator LytT